eukprot:365253-Chlamydomonas_euryale.AAC.1
MQSSAVASGSPGQVAAAGSGHRQGVRNEAEGLESWGRGQAGGRAGVGYGRLGWQRRGRNGGLQRWEALRLPFSLGGTGAR